MEQKKIRYGVVGLGWIAQAAVLPAFKNAAENSELTALISGDAEKRKELGAMYGIEHTFGYDQYEEALKHVDAVYLALPNHLHCDYTVRAARAGKHVLCEKPMALSEEECNTMIDACRENGVKLMVAYRLHFEEATLRAIDLVESGRIGDPRYFMSANSQSVRAGDIRLKRALGGGPLWDMGVYCINAARYMFRDEPTEVVGFADTGRDPRFTEVEETFSAILRFPQGRTAAFTCSFGCQQVDMFRVVGTAGELRLEPAYSFVHGMKHYLSVDDAPTEELAFGKTDHFGPELIYFSDCILHEAEPEPSGLEGLADVRVIEALLKSAATGRAATVKPTILRARPSLSQREVKPAVMEPELVNAKPAA